MKDDFWKIFRGSILVAISIVFLMLACSSCNIFQALKKDKEETKNDSTNVKKGTEVSSSVDTSKTKSASTKETVYYPQPIIVPGKDGETKIVFVPQTVKETGTEEKQNFNFDNYRRDFLDSVRIAELEKKLSKESEIKGSVLGMGFWIGITIVGLVLIGLMVMILKMKNQFTSINNLLNKTKEHER